MAKRIKSSAAIYVAQTQDDVVNDIKVIGDLARENTRLETEMNDQIGEIAKRYAPIFEVNKERLNILQKGVQAWCEANRDKLTNGGKTKSINLVTGEVQWRTRPPSVTIRGVESVIETLKKLGLARFVRSKEEVNKEAILNEKEVLRGIAGITLNSGIEDFAIIPFEQTAE